HTDNYGKDSYHDRLSLRRATTVTNLLASVGILRASIEPRSMGKRNPVTNNRTAKRPAQNRRVAIIVTP
ncbi:MAG: OmpA family protein, partial [Serratia symbiotica]|nr:OmpA family protein [Serratia symbiotica]